MEKKITKLYVIYRIDNKVTGDFFIGRTNNIQRRWYEHNKESAWRQHPNSQLYKDIQAYGIENFELTVICEVGADKVREVEQKIIDEFHPTYNNYNAFGLNIERRDAYYRSSKRKEYLYNYHHRPDIIKRHRRYNQKYGKEHKQDTSERVKKYWGTERGKKANAKNCKKYLSQKCFYEGEYITLNALAQKLRKIGFSSPYKEA